MSWRTEETLPASVREAFQALTVDSLKPLVRLLTAGDLPKRKGELVSFLAEALQQPQRVRAIYDGLDALGQAAVQEAVHDSEGKLRLGLFNAKYGKPPAFHEPLAGDERRHSYSYRPTVPTPLALFFPQHHFLPSDLRTRLLEFVPEPAEYALPTRAELPATIRHAWKMWEDRLEDEEGEEAPLRMRETAREGFHDVKAVLRLIQTGRVRVSDKKRQPTTASREAIAAVLLNGDFYATEDQDESKYDPAHDLGVKTFAWPMIVQAAGLVQRKGDALALAPAGVKALSKPGAEVARAAWNKWRTSTILDEFSRVEGIKGQTKARLSALTTRRKAVLDGLAQCPAGQWFAVDDFYRFLRATGRDFVMAQETYDLYIAEHHYGNLGDEGEHLWELLQGRYILALLFEYAATMGLLDVGYLPPQGARNDFGDRWGTDDLSCLSRYDGLIYVRINAFGAWCLGLAERYEAPAVLRAEVVEVLPNLDLVAKQQPLDAADRLLLDRFAERQSEAVWRLTAPRILQVLEGGGSLDELEEFLAARSQGPLPQTARVFLDDLRRRAGRLRDLGTARVIECADAETARMLAADPLLREKCQLAGDRQLVFRMDDEAAVRKALRRLGHILAPPRD